VAEHGAEFVEWQSLFWGAFLSRASLKKIDIIVKFRGKTPTPGHMTHGPPFNKTEKAGVDRHRGYHNNNTML